ncbi:hypothetical protein [Butyrivibrio sp. AD3002]|uniref:hypothetical protein n=1 Tax=Butyrivibrio sp. AD3002 TaxID=1280670 RepID=UPI0003B6148D|nr:hypothetical protein [Butyrivibrio sp. AD3002]
MKKKLSIFVVSVVLAIAFIGCGKTETSEMVKAVQHKIDKALESNPSYADLTEIVNDYDELLIAEQEQVKDFDKIEKKISDYQKAASNDESIQRSVRAIEMIKEQLKHPNSMEIRSIEYGEQTNDDINIAKHVHIEFAADNEVGGSAVGAAMYTYIYYPNGDNTNKEWIYFDSDNMYAGDVATMKYWDFIKEVDVETVLNVSK